MFNHVINPDALIMGIIFCSVIIVATYIWYSERKYLEKLDKKVIEDTRVTKELLTKHISIKKSKKPDRRVFSQEDFDIIIAIHSEFIEHNASCDRYSKLTQKDLAIRLNNVLGFDKTVSAYAPVWNGKVNREDLPVQRKA